MVSISVSSIICVPSSDCIPPFSLNAPTDSIRIIILIEGLNRRVESR